MNIPVPAPIQLKEQNESGEPGAKRQRVDDTLAGTKVMTLPNGTVKCNTPICEIIKVVKPVIRALVEDCK